MPRLLTSRAASVTVHPFGRLPVDQQQTHVLEINVLETKVFICYNALADPLASRELQEFCLTVCAPCGHSTEDARLATGPSIAPGGQGLPARPFRASARDSAAVEKIPCLGKVDPRYLLKAFEAGCDAVCLIGCAIGKCRTMDGNLRAQKRVVLVRGLLEEIGLKAERLFLFLREPMTEQAARELVGQFIAEARALGPSELKAQSVDGPWQPVGRARISPQRTQRTQR